MTGPSSPAHTSATLRTWRRLRQLRNNKAAIVLDGSSLEIADVVAVARHAVDPVISDEPALAKQLDRGVDALAACLARDWIIYGVNTGFGGSADTRTDGLERLQLHLLQHLQSAIITAADKDPITYAVHGRSPHVMPVDWVRGAIVARANQNLRGHSAIRLSVIRGLVDLLHKDLTPLVPLRGSISASGDLMPMAYIAGALTGNPDILVRTCHGTDPPRILPAPDALRLAGLPTARMGPKEALGLVNGTAPSVAAASLVLHDAQHLALVSQMLTALTAEALAGNVEWLQSFIHAARPHPGQIEAAANMRRFLRGSRMVVGLDTRKRIGAGLWQDRYSTRTAPQWIGPYLEDLLLAQRQVEVELNSTSDNPLVNASPESALKGDSPDGVDVFSGGNFQATVITSAMDKTRMALQMIGRLLFSQVTEMISPVTNNGLEANLNNSSEISFTMKGIDINMSAYMSELASLAHPVSAHVMSAEMHNQSVNSLALLTARRTEEAADLVAHMCACHLYVSCQAVEMRANHRHFLDNLRNVKLPDATPAGVLHGLGLEPADAKRLADQIWPVIESTWYHWNSSTWKDRTTHVADAVMSPVTEFLSTEGLDCSVSQLGAFKRHFEEALTAAAGSSFERDARLSPAAVATHLGDGSARLYNWVRSKLNVPSHAGIDDDPLYNALEGLPADGKKTTGSWVSMVYESIRKGDLMDTVMEGVEASLETPQSNGLDGPCKGMTNGH